MICSLNHRPSTELQGLVDHQDAPFIYYPCQVPSQAYNLPPPPTLFAPFSCTPSPPSAALIRRPSSCITSQPRPYYRGAHCQRINALPAGQEVAHGLEMEGVPFDWNDYLSSEGLSDIGHTGMHDGGQTVQAG